jgi:beta-glucuronidase
MTVLDGQWMIATDPENVGRTQKWFQGPTAGARSIRVPGILQEAFPGYHGVVWYWRDFHAEANPYAKGRYLLEFDVVDYRAEVWVNDVYIGSHEGAETPFVLDITDAARSNASNRLAVRTATRPSPSIRAMGTTPVESANRLHSF